MVQCKTILSVIGFVILLFFGIPIRIYPPPVVQNDSLQLFENFINKFNKTDYLNNRTLWLEKFAAFENTLKNIEKLNSQRVHNQSAVFGITQFSDLTPDQFVAKYLQSDLSERIKNNTDLYERHSSESNSIEVTLVKRSLKQLPKKVDWRNKKVVTAINNQKNCGACWAFSTVETIESMKAMKTNHLDSLSVQELIDCAGFNNAGCEGGDVCSLVNWLFTSKVHIRKEKEYPLHWKTETCKLNKSLPGVQVSDFACNSFAKDETLLMETLAYQGPVAVAINALLWQNYLGGIIQYHCDSSPSLLNHAVQIVGYDQTGEIPFYIVRNSWGKEFGDKGYLYIAIGNNVCGLANEVVSLNVF